jgi:DNA-directed RNA polymerase subunit alpha
MSPEEAVSNAASLFTQHLELFVRFGDSIAAPQAQRGAQTQANRLNEVPIEELDLSVRAFNCLKANDITTVGQLLGKKEEELLSLRNFGRKSLDEIKEKLVEKGYVPAEEMDSVFRGTTTAS